jgi:hypothetical protein
MNWRLFAIFVCGLIWLQETTAQDKFDVAVCQAHTDTKERQRCLDSLSQPQETYKNWKPYLEYLMLPSSYHSPEAEESYRIAFEAEKAVKNQPSKDGGTLEKYFQELANKPVVDDLGWATYVSEGGISVERIILINGRATIYRWSVNQHGDVSTENGAAMSITK